MPIFAIDPLIAAAVVVATACTDAGTTIHDLIRYS